MMQTSNLPSIIALNAVSTLAQIGQFGLGTMLIPIAMEAQQATPSNIGFTSSAFWLGMLAGLLIAGYLTRFLGYRNTVIVGLIISAMSFALMPFIDWHWWAFTAFFIGLGMGLRWIANETWLYRLVPINARGRVVGIHETLIALASIAAPLIIVAFGALNATAFWLAAGIMLTAIVPLFMAATLPAVDKLNVKKLDINNQSINNPVTYNPVTYKQVTNKQVTNKQVISLVVDVNASSSQAVSITQLSFWLGLGALIAGCGGWVEGSLLALLPVYNNSIGLSVENNAWLFTIFGMGALVMQYPIGWLSDKIGVLATAKLVTLFGGMSILLVLSFNHFLPALTTALFILGAVTGGTLTLGTIWSTQHNNGTDITNRVRQVSIVYTLFSAAGPFVSGIVVDQTNSHSLFWQQFVIFGVLGFVLFRQKNN